MLNRKRLCPFILKIVDFEGLPEDYPSIPTGTVQPSLIGNANRKCFKSEMPSERLCALMVDFEGLADIFFSFAKEKIQKSFVKIFATI